MAIYITGAPIYAPADGASTIDLTIVSNSFRNHDQPPEIIPNRGTLTFLDRTAPDTWTASLTDLGDPGRIEFTTPDGETVVLLNDLYFIPEDPQAIETGPPEVLAGFTIEVYAPLGIATLSSTNVSNRFGSSVSIQPFSVNPFSILDFGLAQLFGNVLSTSLPDPLGLFGDTVTIWVAVQGTGLPQDLTDLQMVFDPGPDLARLGDPGACPGVDQPCYQLGDFPATDRAVKYENFPAWWYAELQFSKPGSDYIELSGRITARAPTPDPDHAAFTIQPYLTIVGTDAITVSWETDREAESFIAYGPTPDCDQVKGGVTERLRIHDGLDLSVAPRFNAFFHRVTLTGLEAGQTYYYRVLAAQNPTGPEDFKSPPPPGDSFTFGVIGDTQAGHEVHGHLMNLMAEQGLDFFLHAGDHVQDSNIPDEWYTYFELEAPLIKNTPIASTLGNHDQSLLNHFYRRYFAPQGPYPDSKILNGRMYSFDYGNSHFVFIDTTQPLDALSPTHQWLEDDLTAAQANPQRKFTFVVEHFNIYTSFVYGYWPTGQLLLEPLYESHDVDAVFSGHIHLYERSSVNGRPYICSSGGGGNIRVDAQDLGLDPYYVTHAFVHHFLRVTVNPDSFDLQAIDEGGNLIDQVHYAKP